MSDYQNETPEAVDVDSPESDVAGSDGLTKDQRRIAEWQDAAQQAPSREDVENMAREVSEIREMLANQEAAYEAAVVRRALVFGWKRVADEANTTAKMLHTWQTRHGVDAPDLSSVPEKEMSREEKRIAAATKRLEEELKLRDEIAAQQARLAAAREGLNR